DKKSLRQQRFHRFMQLIGLRAVALVHKDKEVALSLKVGRERFFNFFCEGSDVSFLLEPLSAKLVDERAEQPRIGLAEFCDEVRSAFGAVDAFVNAGINLLDLLIQLVAVGDDEYSGIVDILSKPLGQPYH